MVLIVCDVLRKNVLSNNLRDYLFLYSSNNGIALDRIYHVATNISYLLTWLLLDLKI